MIVVFDLDGTICFDGKEIEKSLIGAIKDLENHGYTIVFASARPIRDMMPLLKQDFFENFFIGGNGAIVKENETLKVLKSIDHESFECIKSVINRWDLDFVIDDSWDYSMRNRNDALSKINDKIDALHLAKNIPLDKIKSPVKTILLNLPSSQYENILSEIQKLPIEIVRHRGSLSLDITAKGIDKYTAFKRFFNPKEAVVFGNDENDRALLMQAKNAIIVGENPQLRDLTGLFIPENIKTILKTIASLKEKAWEN